MHIYTDSDWAGDKVDRKSWMGSLVQLDSENVIAWWAKKQGVVALSTMEAEYIAM